MVKNFFYITLERISQENDLNFQVHSENIQFLGNLYFIYEIESALLLSTRSNRYGYPIYDKITALLLLRIVQRLSRA